MQRLQDMLGVAMSRVIFFLSINTTGHVVLCIFCIHSLGPPRLNSKSIVKRNFLELEKTILYSQQDDELFVYERGRQTARKINTQSTPKQTRSRDSIQPRGNATASWGRTLSEDLQACNWHITTRQPNSTSLIGRDYILHRDSELQVYCWLFGGMSGLKCKSQKINRICNIFCDFSKEMTLLESWVDWLYM